MAALIISNEEIDDILKIIKSFQVFDFLLKGVSKITKNEAKEQVKRKGVFLGML